MAPRRAALYVASFALHAWLATFLDKPGQVLAGAYLIEVVVLLLLIEVLYRLYHATDSERMRGRLRDLVSSPAQAGMAAPISSASLLGCLFVMAAFFWPFTAYAGAALKQEASWVVTISVALAARQLMSGGIVMDFAQGKENNFGYNLKWIFAILVMIIAGVVVMLGASLANGFDLIPEGKGERVAEVSIALIVLASVHVIDYFAHLEAERRTAPPS
jgi:hypothetical protein